MSEYQYYEFIAIDRPLTAKEVARLRSVSTRARITPTSFVNEYHWGDLKADPVDLMRRFFDAHLYLADWGSAVLMLKLPRECIEHKVLKVFSGNDYLHVEKLPEHWLLTWSVGESEDYDRFGCIEGNGWMTRLAPLREELLRGDYRSLYIGWLRAVTTGEIAAHGLEPMALNGLGELTAAQQALAEFIEVDGDLLAAAGIGNPTAQSSVADEATTDSWLDALPKTEVRGYLRQLLNGQGANAERALKRRYSTWQAESRPQATGVRRSVEALWQHAEQAKELRLQKEAKAKRRAEAASRKKREARLSMMANNLPREWKVAHDEANRGHASAYDSACRQLTDLRDAYVLFSTAAKFQQAFDQFIDAHRRRRALLERLAKAGLMQAEK
jgi:hypothetical protein